MFGIGSHTRQDEKFFIPRPRRAKPSTLWDHLNQQTHPDKVLRLETLAKTFLENLPFCT